VISGNLDRPRIDDTFAQVAERFPAHLREPASGLAHRLGLTETPAQGFESFVVMAPNRDLPRYAAEDPRRPGSCRLSPEALAPWRRAHHCAAVFGLVSDRLDDGQVAPAPWVEGIRDEMLAAWTAELGLALGSPARAHALVGAALRQLEQGNSMERQALSRTRELGPGTLSGAQYVRMTCAKLAWFGVSGHGVLLFLDEPRRARALRDAYDTFSVALQCIDDALDAESDERVRGACFPAALGLPPEALLTASKGLLARAARMAKKARFHELAEWLSNMAGRAAAAYVAGDPLRNALGASVLHAAAEEVIPC
jgi:hypothetical protein